MRKVAIIGSTSFLAKKLIEKLAKEDLVIEFWNRNPSKNEFLFNYPNSIPDVKVLASFDAILYLAGEGVQSNQKPSFENLYGINTITPINLIAQLRDLNFKGAFISFGSYFELGKTTASTAANEEDIIYSSNPAFNEYCKSKHLLSHFIQKQLDEELSFSLLHFIIPNMYGKGENENRLLPYVVKNIRQQSPLYLSHGAQVRQFLHVSDLTNFLCWRLRESKFESGIYNLGSKQIMSVATLVERTVGVAKKLGFELPKIEFGKAERLDAQASYLVLDDQKAKMELGWKAEKDMDESIKEYFE
ncbi:NAD(P)-dependent oxidoreductase [Marivirga arenosa]|uniref:NAD(P)-dependent oxidoreductase n=1 Tax=Marivirga arenosa TaxID=3059076 RepID=A0AA49GGD7_9BACT|nr:NAD(P)-dependent oxidoreductase [Marivirga sp. ABR2-2]WKK86746.1 NAD(P)-dependent oxidoreductase [Marivirga sp. ABR2-2]